MEAVKTQFHLELDSLIKLLKFYKNEALLLKDYDFKNDDPIHSSFDILRNELISFGTKKREYNYKSIVISLYGYFEKYIEDSLNSLALRLNDIYKLYKDIPENIQQNHLELSIKLLDKVINTNNRLNLNPDQIVLNLNRCLNDTQGYSLINEAFSQHTYNYRIHAICEAFSKLNLSNLKSSLLRNNDFKKYLLKSAGKQKNEKLTEDEAFFILDDLVERRNEVAHGVSNQILSLDILLDYIGYFKKFSTALNATIINQLNLFEANQSGIRIGEVLNLYNERKVLIAKNNFLEIRQGSYIIGLSTTKTVKAKVLNIQIDGQDVESVSKTQNVEIGLLLDKKFYKNLIIYLI